MLRAMNQPSDLPPQPAEYYRRKAARARQVAEGVTTRAIKLRLLELALEYDKLADGTESATRPPTGIFDICFLHRSRSQVTQPPRGALSPVAPLSPARPAISRRACGSFRNHNGHTETGCRSRCSNDAVRVERTRP